MFKKNKKTIFIIMLLMCFVSNSTHAQKIDISDFIFPSIFNGKSRGIFGGEVLNKELIEDQVFIEENNNGLTTTDYYDLYTEKGMKEFNKKNKMEQISSFKTSHVIRDNDILIAKRNPMKGYNYGYKIPRYIEVNKEYTDKTVGTARAELPVFDVNLKVSDRFSLTTENGSDCLVHNRKEYEIKSKQTRSNITYLYCKPYGLVVEQIHNNDGSDFTNKKLRKMEEL
ncbi:hypothetical protein TUM20903_48100 (plasmid) [Citrobacter koseri]|uniref:hypothetical protein n=1 Tax=Citrobacter koseri TaxID=545 RepID=UPI002E0DEBD9|nr:hypothetical protein [Citrobacter koseri]BDG92072.1 hypothetical protein TUM20903_48100 [Citrobacter koseri]